MDHLVRRALQSKYPENLQPTIEILNRIPPTSANAGGSSVAIPGINESLNDAIKQVIYENIFTIKGAVSFVVHYVASLFSFSWYDGMDDTDR